MLTRFDGICFICGKSVKAGKGDFQSKNSIPKRIRHIIAGKWLVRCFGCKNMGNFPQETSPFYQIVKKEYTK